MRVGIMVNPQKPKAAQTVSALRQALMERQIQVRLENTAAALLDEQEQGLDAVELAQQSDILAVLGGDGTMLAAMERLGSSVVPVAGINIGTLGFLTSCTHDELDFFADCLVMGAYELSPRTILRVRLLYPDGSDREMVALNEVALTRGLTGKLVSVAARINGEQINHYRADGLIVATPTGSTGYSLSAGGPLICPDAAVLVITPICPHSLSYRSLVVSDDVEVNMQPDATGEETMHLTVDGRVTLAIGVGTQVRVTKARDRFPLLRLRDRSFFEALRQKLGWRG